VVKVTCSLPASLVHSTPNDQKIIHRLLYRALPSLDANSVSSDGVTQRKIIAFDVALTQPQVASDASSAPLAVEPRCEIGSETVLHLMMPDRCVRRGTSTVPSA
jgi:hypothetical protein